MYRGAQDCPRKDRNTSAESELCHSDESAYCRDCKVYKEIPERVDIDGGLGHNIQSEISILIT